MKKIIPSILVILLPYLYLIFSLLINKIQNTDLAVIIYLVMFFITIILLVTSAIGTSIIFSVNNIPLKSAIINFLTKFAYIPVHLLMILLLGAFMNPFLIAFLLVPIFLSISFQVLTGIVSLGTFIGSYKFKNCNLALSILGCILSFFYIIDIVMAIIILIVNIYKVIKRKHIKNSATI